MSLIGKSQQLLVATAIAIGYQIIRTAIRIKLKDATDLLLTITVGCQEPARETVIAHLYLSADNRHITEERLYPVVDARADNQHIVTSSLCLQQGFDALNTQEITVIIRKLTTEGIEGLERRPLKEIGEDMLFGLPIRIEPQLHQYQQMGVTEESPPESPRAFGITDKGQQRIASGQRTVEIKGKDAERSLEFIV